MCVVSSVAHHEAVAYALLEDKLALVRIRFAIDQKQIEFSCAARNLFKDHLDGLLRGWAGHSRAAGGAVAEEGVVPGVLGWIDPLRLLVLACVLDHNAETGLAHGLFCAAENPDAGMIHFDFGIDALAGAEENGIESLRGGYR